MLPRKASREVLADRTPNHLRWSGREYQGDRANCAQETRQNSAVPSGEGGPFTVNILAVGSGGWSQRPVRSDCLLKTQVRAKSKDDVYGLTPARCWNVKGTG